MGSMRHRASFSAIRAKTGRRMLVRQLVLLTVMNQTLVAVSPFNCRWIHRTSDSQAEDPRYAICMRPPLGPRVVCATECEHCPAWEDSHASEYTTSN